MSQDLGLLWLGLGHNEYLLSPPGSLPARLVRPARPRPDEPHANPTTSRDRPMSFTNDGRGRNLGKPPVRG